MCSPLKPDVESQKSFSRIQKNVEDFPKGYFAASLHNVVAPAHFGD